MKEMVVAAFYLDLLRVSDLCNNTVEISKMLFRLCVSIVGSAVLVCCVASTEALVT